MSANQKSSKLDVIASFKGAQGAAIQSANGGMSAPLTDTGGLFAFAGGIATAARCARGFRV